MKCSTYTSTICLLCVLLLPPPHAGHAGKMKSAHSFLNKFSFSAGLGYLEGKSDEFVFDEGAGRKLSELNWDIESAAIIKGAIQFDALPWLTLTASGWNTLNKGNAILDDYDWLNPSQAEWSDWSHHENTQLRYANEFDLSVTGWVLDKEHYKLGLMGGYNRSTVSYLSVGGCFIYGGGSAIGCFPENQIGIGYQQKFNTGYVGLTGSYFINKWDVNALFKYGPSVNAKDVDQHYQRSLTFKEKGHGADFYSFSLTSGYKIHSDLRVFLEGVYNQFDHQKADTTIINHNTNTLSRINNSAGLSYTNYMVSLGIQYNPAMS